MFPEIMKLFDMNIEAEAERILKEINDTRRPSEKAHEL